MEKPLRLDDVFLVSREKFDFPIAAGAGGGGSDVSFYLRNATYGIGTTSLSDFATAYFTNII